MQRIRTPRPYTAGELEHMRINKMLNDHERWSMTTLWAFIAYWFLWSVAVVGAIWYYWPFS